MSVVEPRPADQCRWDLVSLGEVMLRLDPGEGRIATTRSFRVWEGGGEYNVARALKRCFGLRTAVVTALADNPVGRLIEDLMYQGGVDHAQLNWIPYDGIGRQVRNGLNFTERGFGVRAALGCSDRANSAASIASRRNSGSADSVSGRNACANFSALDPKNTICSVSPDWPGTARWRRLAAAALGVPDSVVPWA